jgi:hypothetical protein
MLSLQQIFPVIFLQIQTKNNVEIMQEIENQRKEYLKRNLKIYKKIKL